MIIRKILSSILYILLLLYLIIFIPVIWGYKPLVIISGSMEPKLKVGGILYYKKINQAEYKINDIVVFKSKKYLISHRIVEISNDGFITKGDANKTIDTNKVYFEKALGKGTDWSIPYIGYYADFIYKNKWILIIIFMMLLSNSILSNYEVEDNENNS